MIIIIEQQASEQGTEWWWRKHWSDLYYADWICFMFNRLAIQWNGTETFLTKYYNILS